MDGVIRSGNIKTRKDHKCHGCKEVIPKGTTTYSEIQAYEGKIETLYECNKCVEWCIKKDCMDCLISENAYEGYIKECMKENGCWEGDK